jgi:hypothetical protein
MNAITTFTPPKGGLLSDATKFEFGQRAANLFAASQLVPAHLRGKPQDCFIALHMAERMGEDPLMVMQNIVIVSGTAGWKTQFMIAKANAAGVFKGRINWRVEGEGERLKVTAFAHLLDTGDEVSASADMRMAKAEGWTKNAKYTSMPEHMLRWRSAAFLIRLYCPEVMMGMQTAEEVEDVRLAVASNTAMDVTPSAALAARLDHRPGSVTATVDHALSEPAHDPETGEITEQAGGDDAAADEAAAQADGMDAGAADASVVVGVDAPASDSSDEDRPPKAAVMAGLEKAARYGMDALKKARGNLPDFAHETLDEADHKALEAIARKADAAKADFPGDRAR